MFVNICNCFAEYNKLELLLQSIRDVLLLGHRQAFTWVDEWYGMTITDVRIYECEMQRETNEKVVQGEVQEEENRDEVEDENEDEVKAEASQTNSSFLNGLESPKAASNAAKGWFFWS